MSRTDAIMLILHEEGLLAGTPRLVEEDVRRRIAETVNEIELTEPGAIA